LRRLVWIGPAPAGVPRKHALGRRRSDLPGATTSPRHWVADVRDERPGESAGRRRKTAGRRAGRRRVLRKRHAQRLKTVRRLARRRPRLSAGGEIRKARAQRRAARTMGFARK
jgi:hypothetical protein